MPSFRFQAEILDLHPRNVFRISRKDEAEVNNVWLRIESDGIVGQGEASPDPFYSETAHDVRRRLTKLNASLPFKAPDNATDIARISRELAPILDPSRAAQCALDLALWDWLAQKHQKSVVEMVAAKKPRPIKSFCTIGLSTPPELEQKVTELRDYPLIKIKMNRDADLDVVRYVRERTNASLSVDANCSWGEVDIGRVSAALADLGVLFIEQPLGPHENDRMPDVLKSSALPIIADESCVNYEDLKTIPGRFSGFNIKLVKCGGISTGLAMLRRGQELGLRTMVGCMLESSILISAGAVIGQETDFADLDGSWLLRDDPFEGVGFDRGVLTLSGKPGLGVGWRGR